VCRGTMLDREAVDARRKRKQAAARKGAAGKKAAGKKSGATARKG
jgi:hypothetical protein